MKKNRMNGMKYNGISKGEFCEKMPRVMKASCNSKFCEKSSTRHCSVFSEKIREEIFNRFWQMSWKQKKLYVINLIECSTRKRVYVENSRRSISKKYFLNNNTIRLQVCSKMFLSTLGITETTARNWFDSGELHGTQIDPENQKSMNAEKKQVRKKNVQYEENLNWLKKWLQTVPMMESHYRRKYCIFSISSQISKM